MGIWRDRKRRAGLRILAAALLGAMLASCAALKEAAHPQAARSEAPPTPAPRPKPAPAPKPPVAKAKENPHPVRIATIDPDSLIGLPPEEVGRILGAPQKSDRQDIALVWTYNAENCALRIFFYPSIKTSAFQVLKYSGINSRGAPLDAGQPCIRRILTVRGNG